MHLDLLRAYGICSKIVIHTPSKRLVKKCEAEKRPCTKCPVHETFFNETFVDKSLLTKCSLAKRPAMKCPDKFKTYPLQIELDNC